MTTTAEAQFEYRVNEWRKTIAIAGSPDAKMSCFQEAAYDLSGFLDAGIKKPDINDVLMDIGRAHNLGNDGDLTAYIGDQQQRRLSEPAYLEEPQEPYKPNGPQKNGAQQTKSNVIELPKIRSKAEFLAELMMPPPLIDSVLQRGYIYALTGVTGHAKTALALLIAELVSSIGPRKLGPYEVEKGRVLYFVGENPDDVRIRVTGSDKLRDDQPERDDISFIPGVFDIGAMMVTIRADLKKNGEAALIIVDTSAAYFLGNEELSNTQMGAYARLLRTLTNLPGRPTVLVLCHPVKHVDEPSKLTPRGGGAYLAEMDGNLTLWQIKEPTLTADGIVKLHHTKMRGPQFQPLNFEIETIKEAIQNTKGRWIKTVRAVFISDSEEEKAHDAADLEERQLMCAMLKLETGSLMDWAKELGWFYPSGDPAKSRVQRLLENLDKERNKGKRLVDKDRKKWRLTEEGKKVARDAGAEFERQRMAADQKEQPRLFG
jgi:RecA-family ATPase